MRAGRLVNISGTGARHAPPCPQPPLPRDGDARAGYKCPGSLSSRRRAARAAHSAVRHGKPGGRARHRTGHDAPFRAALRRSAGAGMGTVVASYLAVTHRGLPPSPSGSKPLAGLVAKRRAGTWRPDGEPAGTRRYGPRSAQRYRGHGADECGKVWTPPRRHAPWDARKAVSRRTCPEPCTRCASS
jgi:hypothetical protein